MCIEPEENTSAGKKWRLEDWSPRNQRKFTRKEALRKGGEEVLDTPQAL